MSSIVNADGRLNAPWGGKGERRLEDTGLNRILLVDIILDNHRNTLEIVRRRNEGDDWNQLTNLPQASSFVIPGNLFVNNIFS